MIKIGTRKSRLALNQTHQVVSLIKKFYPKINIEIVPIITSGDIIVDRNLYDIGGKALFLKEIENSLLSGEIDLAVHSFKDVPGVLPQNLEIAAVLERANPQDVFISHSYKSINDLPYKAKVGSSSVRRKILVNEIRPDIEICVFRGNIDTRLEKLKMGEVDATILSAAGLERLNLLNMHYCHMLDTEKFIPAIGQGIIAVETRIDHKLAKDICAAINHLPTWKLIKAERAFMSYLDANCRTPMGAFSKYIDDNTINVDFMLANFEGSIIHRLSGSSNVDQATELGIRIAQELEAKFEKYG